MKDIKKGFMRLFSASLISSIVILVLGIFLFIQPDTVIRMISIVLGIIILIPGIVSLIDYFKTKNYANLITGIVTVLISLILIIDTELVASILPFILGIYFVVNGINRLTYAMELRRQNVSNYVSSFVFSLLIMITGIVFIIDPFKGALAITKISGIFMIIYALLDITNAIVIKRGISEVTDMKNAIIEVEAVEKND